MTLSAPANHTGCTFNQASQVCWPLSAQPRKALIFPLWTWIWTGNGEEGALFSGV